MTAEEAAQTYNLPSALTLRTMRRQGLPAVRIGKAYLFDAADIEAHITAAKVTTCPAQIADRRSNGSSSANAGTSSGMRPGGSVAVLLARQTAGKLKKRSAA